MGREIKVVRVTMIDDDTFETTNEVLNGTFLNNDETEIELETGLEIGTFDCKTVIATDGENTAEYDGIDIWAPDDEGDDYYVVQEDLE